MVWDCDTKKDRLTQRLVLNNDEGREGRKGFPGVLVADYLALYNLIEIIL